MFKGLSLHTLIVFILVEFSLHFCLLVNPGAIDLAAVMETEGVIWLVWPSV